ncbi:MAG: adenine-specific methyltransferase EcoRI family protein [Acholeplasmatales bacterium]|jgi:hypothetical protein|nr:adenine-specific methyltransferase EcoRI family protein [Acholeplasmatales bacterium]
MANLNNSLGQSRINKNDEFYTYIDDIKNEISLYDLKLFDKKVIYCNCDDPTWSNFFKFFVKFGRQLNVKEVHFTNYANSKRDLEAPLSLFDYLDFEESASDDKKGTAHHWIYDPASDKITKSELIGNGDFRSKECIDIMKSSDIIITNPPFSLLTEFLSLLISNSKNFLIIGNENEIASKSWCSYFINNKIWLGNTKPKKFLSPDGTIKTLGFVCWFTNLDVSYRQKPKLLHIQNLDQFEKYDNYDAIEIPSRKLIPDNYYGNMGVPIFFVEEFCPDQFEIIDTTPAYGMVPKINGRKIYRRLIIKRKTK